MQRHENHEGEKLRDPQDRSRNPSHGNPQKDKREAMIKYIKEEIVTDLKKKCSVMK